MFDATLLRAGRIRGWMDLLAAIMQRSLIHDICRHAGYRRARQCTLPEGAVAHRREECTAIRAQLSPELRSQRREVRLLRGRNTSVPCLEAIHRRRHFRSARMNSTWVTAIFNINPEDHIP